MTKEYIRGDHYHEDDDPGSEDDAKSIKAMVSVRPQDRHKFAPMTPIPTTKLHAGAESQILNVIRAETHAIRRSLPRQTKAIVTRDGLNGITRRLYLTSDHNV